MIVRLFWIDKKKEMEWGKLKESFSRSMKK